MKKPNNYGSVYKLPGNRRKPWTARITVSRTLDPDGKSHFKYSYLGYYENQSQAEIALARYNELPYDVESRKATFADVYEMWSTPFYSHTSRSNENSYRAAYKCCGYLESMRFCDIRSFHLQHVIDTCGKNYPTLKKVRDLFSVMYKYALANDLCAKAYKVDISQYSDRNPNKIERIPFTTQEVDTIWKQQDTDEYFSVILILIYSGCRISELLNLKKENVHLEERWFNLTVSTKTKAGVRTVPIAKKVLPFFERWMNKNDCEYLVSTYEGQQIEYHNFLYTFWNPLMEQIGMKHRPHDTRHTCITMLRNAGVEERIVQKIVGHRGSGVTELVYTHYEIKQLLEAIDKI